MNKIALIILISINFNWSYGQIDNRWQPDSVYKNKRVKKIFVFENSPKDLSKIVTLDDNGRRIHIESYSASYNRRTRKFKTVDRATAQLFDSVGRIIQKIDTIFYSSISIDRTIYHYENDLLISSKYFRDKFDKPSSVTTYTHNPFSSTTTSSVDTLIVYQKTKEYEKDFYVKKFYGYVLQPKLKKIQSVINGKMETFSYSDNTDRQRYDEVAIYLNTYNSYGQIIQSEIKSVFMNDRVNEYTLHYKYRNGLLESIFGHVPLYFKYEYFE